MTSNFGLEFRKIIDLWENSEKKNQIEMLIDGQNLIMFFLHNNELYGTQEPHRVTFARMLHPDEEDTAGWKDDANFMAVNLSRAVVGAPTQHMFKIDDIKDIKIIEDKEKIYKILLSIADEVNSHTIANSVKRLSLIKPSKDEPTINQGNENADIKTKVYSTPLQTPDQGEYETDGATSDEPDFSSIEGKQGKVMPLAVRRELKKYQSELNNQLNGLLLRYGELADYLLDHYQKGTSPPDEDKVNKAEYDVLVRMINQKSKGFLPNVISKEPIDAPMEIGPELLQKVKDSYIKLKRGGLSERFLNLLDEKEQELMHKYYLNVKDFESQYGPRKGPWDQ